MKKIFKIFISVVILFGSLTAFNGCFDKKGQKQKYQHPKVRSGG